MSLYKFMKNISGFLAIFSIFLFGPIFSNSDCNPCASPASSNQSEGPGPKIYGSWETAIVFSNSNASYDQSEDLDPENYGSWETIIPEDSGAAHNNILGMQAVHSIMLPSGKILMSSGSSWRNFRGTQYYPKFKDPVVGTGLFPRDQYPFTLNKRLFTLDKKDSYYKLVNNTAIYDPENNTFYRIPHPLPVNGNGIPGQGDEGEFMPNDLFCSGHISLPNGDPIFIGGTQYSSPFWTAAKSSYVFDWRKELGIDWRDVDWRNMPTEDDVNYPWTFSGYMERGRWYPTLVPLLDGRFAIFGGIVGIDEGYPEMYEFEINTFVEFFDPKEFEKGKIQEAWSAVDVKGLDNSPFSTLIDSSLAPGDCSSPTPLDEKERCEESYKYDAFKLYPHNYLLDNDTIFLSREGEWVSMRTAGTRSMRRTKKTYFMNIGGDRKKPTVSFSRGPDREEEITSYGTSFLDPTTNDITIIGGEKTSEGISLPLGAKNPNRYAGGRGLRKIERYTLPSEENKRGSWEFEENFLGDYPQDDRTMLAAIILPTRQILIINGGNYDVYGPVQYPILLTPEFDPVDGKFVKYDRKRMSDAVEPRLYHNAAMLLPDGRVWVAGGNIASATVQRPSGYDTVTKKISGRQPKPDLDLVDLDVYVFNGEALGKTIKGMDMTPTENWTSEIFSPPYLFIDGDRRTEIKRLMDIQPSGDTTFKISLAEDDYYLLKSNSNYRIEITGQVTSGATQDAELVLIKLPSFTHGWDSGQKFISIPFKMNGDIVEFKTPKFQDANIAPGYYMMYYVDKKGKPSPAQMVRLDDTAMAP